MIFSGPRLMAKRCRRADPTAARGRPTVRSVAGKSPARSRVGLVAQTGERRVAAPRGAHDRSGRPSRTVGVDFAAHTVREHRRARRVRRRASASGTSQSTRRPYRLSERRTWRPAPRTRCCPAKSRWKSRRSSGVSGGPIARLAELGRQPPDLHAHAARDQAGRRCAGWLPWRPPDGSRGSGSSTSRARRRRTHGRSGRLRSAARPHSWGSWPGSLSPRHPSLVRSSSPATTAVVAADTPFGRPPGPLEAPGLRLWSHLGGGDDRRGTMRGRGRHHLRPPWRPARSSPRTPFRRFVRALDQGASGHRDRRVALRRRRGRLRARPGRRPRACGAGKISSTHRRGAGDLGHPPLRRRLRGARHGVRVLGRREDRRRPPTGSSTVARAHDALERLWVCSPDVELLRHAAGRAAR